MAKIVLELLQRQFGAAIVATHSDFGNDTAVVEPEELLAIAQYLRDAPQLQFDLPVDCTAVDNLHQLDAVAGRRFAVIWHLYSTSQHHRIRLKVLLTESACSCASLTPIWRGMNWHEREAWDMYGIRFVGHPNLQRVLMYEEFVGHPLRKDYPIDHRQPLIEMLPVSDIATERHPTADMLNPP